jgi:hypothetical protein
MKMAIKLNKAEAYAVYAALDDFLAARRRGQGTKHDYTLSEEQHLKLQGRYLNAFCTLEQIEERNKND